MGFGIVYTKTIKKPMIWHRCGLSVAKVLARWKIIYASKILVPVIIIVILFIGGINAGVITFEAPEKNLEGKNLKGEITATEREINATLTIYFNDETIYSKYIKLPNNASVYNLLMKAAENNEIKIESTYWESFDSIVVDCITYKNVRYASDSNHYWAYYVNGEAGMQGADKQIIKNNDLIEWRFEGD